MIAGILGSLATIVIILILVGVVIGAVVSKRFRR